MDVAFTSEHDVDVRLLDRGLSVIAQKAVRTHIDIPLLKLVVNGSYKATSLDGSSAPALGATPSTKSLSTKRGTKRSSTTTLKGSKATKRRKTVDPAPWAPEVVDVEMLDDPPEATKDTLKETSDALDQTTELHPAEPLPVFSFVACFDLRLARGKSVEHFQPSSRIAKSASLDALFKEEEALADAVRARLRSGDQESVEFCDVVLEPVSQSIKVLAVIDSSHNTTSVLDFALPYPFGGKAKDYDFPYTSSTLSLLHAAIHLSGLPQPRVSIRSTLHASLSLERGRGHVPAIFSVRCTISVLPTIFEHPWSLPQVAQESQRMLLTQIFPLPPQPEDYPGATTIPFFYSSLLPAPATTAPLDVFQPHTLEANLLPFQKRTVSWLLSREGVSLSSEGTVIQAAAARSPDSMFYERVQPFFAPDHTYYFSHLTGSIIPAPPDAPSGEETGAGDGVLGGMLSEEMGLGKTLECLALIILNPAPVERGPANVRQVAGTESLVREVKTTLIVSPGSLIQQWADEIALHAPELKVLIYRGWRREMNSTARDEEGRMAAWAKSTHDLDIVLTTYDDLRRDFYVAVPRKVRPRRETAVYAPEDAEVTRSPLVSVEWWRVIMDEVQLQGDGLAAAVVSLIPRRASLAVSGTPVQGDVRDLVQVLRFLRVPLLSDNNRIWARFLKPAFSQHFVDLFRRIGVRTLKSQVSGELTIPPQRRYIVPIEMGPVERHLYNDLLVSAYAALGVDEHGRSVSGDNASIDSTQLRTWLVRLRQSCTHPQIGQLQRNDRVLGGSLRSIGEVLELMRYQNRQTSMNERRERIEKKTKHAFLIQLDEANISRWKTSLEIFMDLRNDIQALIEEAKATLDAQLVAARAQRKKDQEAGLRAAHDSHLLEGTSSRAKGKSIAAVAMDSDDEDDWLVDDEDARGVRMKPAVDKETRIKTSRVWVRECYILQHKVLFALGDIYHKLGKPEEDEMYGEAETIRRSMLRNSEEVASRAMRKLQVDIVEKGVKREQLEIATAVQRGLRGALLYDEGNQVIALLNEQGNLMWKWRQMLLERLTHPLSKDGEASGEEYAQALDSQGEAEAYLVAYAALLADRKEAISQERTALTLHEFKDANSRRTRAAQNAGIDATFAAAAAELEPQNEVLTRALMQESKRLREGRSKRALKAVVLDVSNLAMTHEREIEGTLLKTEAMRLRKVVTEQEGLFVRLEAELGLFRQAFNARILYFRQLQELSDSVADLDLKTLRDKPLQEAIDDEQAAIRGLDDSIRALLAKQRYLDNLGETNGVGQAASSDVETRECILCSSEFEKGCLTPCGHIYCEDCMNAWFRKGHKACPVCRTPVTRQTVHRIAFEGEKAEEGVLDAGRDRTHSAALATSARSTEYNAISADLLDKINNIEAQGSYGAKVGTLVKHLLYLKKEEPEAKSIVFSAWVDSLNIIERALHENGITYLRVEAGRNAARDFRLDPGCRVLLLHGERQNAGLNVTCASRVFLLEPVVNHAFEIQAIGRVDRMGQTQSTEVFCYYAVDTVEKGVLDLAARNGASIYTKTAAGVSLSLDAFGEVAVTRSPHKGKQAKGDFMAKSEDMMAILFPHLDSDDLAERSPIFDEDMQEEVARSLRRTHAARAAEERLRAAQFQPVAGPSRLRLL